MMRFTCLIVCVLGMISSARGAELEQRLDAVGQRLPEFKQRIDKLRSAGQDVSYPMVSFTVLENFVPLMTSDLNVAVPNGWGWSGINGAISTMIPVQEAHSGQWAVKIVHKTDFAPNVYGLGENSIAAKTTAGKKHTLSVWAKSDKPGHVTFPVNGGWNERLEIQPTAGQWKRFEKTFTAEGAGWTPRILAEMPTEGVLIDDVVLVEGEKAEQGKNLITNGGFEDSWSAARVKRDLPDLEKMAERLDSELKEAESGKKLPIVPRWTGQQRPTIQGPAFIGPTSTWLTPDQHENRPILFAGYGHFGQVRKDVEKFPSYGINIIQSAEWGPSAVYPTEGKFDRTKLDQLLDTLDRGAKAGVAVDFLMSPHYFPGWMFDKYPDIRRGRADFFPFSVYHPKVRELLEKFCDDVLPALKNKPALFSICLSNEPINCQDPDEYSTKSWHEWLAKHHGDVATLNQRWKTSYARFDDIPQPNALNRSPEPRPSGYYMDFIRWNQESFTAFHKLLADAVKKHLPDVPVHIKDTTWHKYRAESVQAGNDVTLFGAITDINGNDSVNLYGFDKAPDGPMERGNADFINGWRENALGYDLQRSGHDAPVFNSENHIIFDRENRYVPPEHTRAALWQGAIYGQSATTIWVWERELENPRGDFAGDIMERPASAEAVGLVCHDLNRVAKEVTALQNAKPDVLILQSFTSAQWEGGKYDDAMKQLYTALSFTGLKIGFLTERQLEQGNITSESASMLFIPGVAHLSDAAFAGLKKFPGNIVFLGEGKPLAKNEYDQPRTAELPQISEPIPFKSGKAKWRDIWTALPPRLEGVKPLVQVRDDKGQPLWGVPWRCARTDQGSIVNLYNARREPVTVALDQSAVDLLTGEQISGKMMLAPMQVRICRTGK